jgi:hypothetical protein
MDTTHTTAPFEPIAAAAAARGRAWRRRLGTALIAALSLAAAAGAGAQGMDAPRPVAHVAPAPLETTAPMDLAQRVAALREHRLRSAIERAVPAPRVAAVVREILPPDVQVVVVPQAPGGLGAYHAGVALSGYAHVHSSRQERQVYGGRRGLIVVDARLEELASRETIAFVLAHEYAHHRLGRGHSAVQADAYAREALAQMGLWSPRAAESAFALAQGPGGSPGHTPAVAERMRALGLGAPVQVLALADLRR